MLSRPPTIKDVGETEVAVGRCSRGQAMPGFQLITRTGKRDNRGDFLMLGKTGSCGRTMGNP